MYNASLMPVRFRLGGKLCNERGVGAVNIWMPGLILNNLLGDTMKRLIVICLMLCVMGVAAPAMLFAAGNAEALEQVAKVSINAGSATDFQTLPGIGAVTAEKIVSFREQNGPFASVDDLIKVKGVGFKTLENLRSMVEL